MAEARYLTRRPIDPAALLASVSDSGLGGTTLFLGTVRRGPQDGPVASIEYTAYDEMVVAEFDRILAEARERWPGGRVAVCHRLGTVPVGEASIAVAVAMPHREDAFAACRYVIEEVKRRLPVWKQETLDDGTRRWQGGHPAGARWAEEADETQREGGSG